MESVSHPPSMLYKYPELRLGDKRYIKITLKIDVDNDDKLWIFSLNINRTADHTAEIKVIAASQCMSLISLHVFHVSL